jgi:hypothetical protein
MRSWVQVLETASYRNSRKCGIHKIQSGQTLVQTLHKRELRAPGCPRILLCWSADISGSVISRASCVSVLWYFRLCDNQKHGAPEKPFSFLNCSHISHKLLRFSVFTRFSRFSGSPGSVLLEIFQNLSRTSVYKICPGSENSVYIITWEKTWMQSSGILQFHTGSYSGMSISKAREYYLFLASSACFIKHHHGSWQWCEQVTTVLEILTFLLWLT